MPAAARVLNPALRSKIMSADEAAALIPSGANVGMSGFTGAGYPKIVPHALARRIMDANLAGEQFRIGVWTGASTAPELDGALAMVAGSSCGCRTSPIRRRATGSTPAISSTSTFT